MKSSLTALPPHTATGQSKEKSLGLCCIGEVIGRGEPKQQISDYWIRKLERQCTT